MVEEKKRNSLRRCKHVAGNVRCQKYAQWKGLNKGFYCHKHFRMMEGVSNTVQAAFDMVESNNIGINTDGDIRLPTDSLQAAIDMVESNINCINTVGDIRETRSTHRITGDNATDTDNDNSTEDESRSSDRDQLINLEQTNHERYASPPPINNMVHINDVQEQSEQLLNRLDGGDRNNVSQSWNYILMTKLLETKDKEVIALKRKVTQLNNHCRKKNDIIRGLTNGINNTLMKYQRGEF